MVRSWALPKCSRVNQHGSFEVQYPTMGRFGSEDGAKGGDQTVLFRRLTTKLGPQQERMVFADMPRSFPMSPGAAGPAGAPY